MLSAIPYLVDTHTKHDDITGVFGVGDPGYYLGPAAIPAGCGFTPTNDRLTAPSQGRGKAVRGMPLWEST